MGVVGALVKVEGMAGREALELGQVEEGHTVRAGLGVAYPEGMPSSWQALQSCAVCRAK